ncbi:ATP-binding cassette domain-containing protein, partial [bacterium]|nr:ATP-binding cassette domain-containing protein [bacterium]
MPLLQVSNMTHYFGGLRAVHNYNLDIEPGQIRGLIGPNGAGKTTLFRMIAGQAMPDEGELTLGETVELAYVDQSRDSLNGDKTVWDEISNGQDIMQIGNTQLQSRSYVGRFNFKGSDQQKVIKDLSGGERNRVHLAK